MFSGFFLMSLSYECHLSASSMGISVGINESTLSRSGILSSEAELAQTELTLAPPPGIGQKLDALLMVEELVVSVMVREELAVVTAGEELVIAAPDWGLAAG